jgi:hypothetical protein
LEIDLQHSFRVLELEPGVPLAKVKRAYRELVKVWHPDRFAPGSHSQGIAQEKLKEINEAYEQLCKKRVPELASGLGGSGGKAAETAESKRPHWQEDFEAAGGDEEDSPGMGAHAPRAGGTQPAMAGEDSVSPWRFWGFVALLCVGFFALWFFSPSSTQAPSARPEGPGVFRGPLAQFVPRFFGGGAPEAPAPSPGGAGDGPGAAAGGRSGPALGRIGVSPLEGAGGPARSPASPAPAPVGPAVPGLAQSGGAAEGPSPDLNQAPPLGGIAGKGVYFTIGSTRDEVVAVQGKPDAFTAGALQYGSSIVVFKDDRVASWVDGNPHLKARLPLDLLGAKVGYFTVGSRKDEVVAIQGQPDGSTPTSFRYGLSTVYFRNDRVEYWRDVDSRLRARVFPRLSGPGFIQPVIVSTMPSSTPATAIALAAPDLSPKNAMPPANATSVLPRRSPDTSDTSASGSRNAPK